MIDYSQNDRRGWCGDPKRGAAMGRESSHLRGDDAKQPVKLYLRRIRLSGDYDRNGTYFGAGKPLYWVCSADQTIDYMVRAEDREDARWHVLQQYPNARFYR